MFMEKTTKKKKNSKKSLRRRIGIIAVGGLSLVLTVCLSVGATLAWFAGSTWASKNLYMGGPVYVEMAGRGKAGSTAGGTEGEAKWVGGDGNLDIKAAAARSTGTVTGGDVNTDAISDDILLPGQKMQIYSQARVFSTAETTTVDDDAIINESSGANTANTSNGTVTYQNSVGRVTTTTTSVLRARFSIDVEFDPSVGFNNFTDVNYMNGYPVQSTAYSGDKGADVSDTSWQAALTDTEFETTNSSTGGADNTDGTVTYTGRRDAVAVGTWTAGQTATDCAAIRAGSKKSIYKWKYVSKAEYDKAGDTASATNMKMAAPFDGSDKSTNSNGYYGVWVCDDTATAGTYACAESDAFYKARCNAYLQTYVEFYVNEYGNTVTRTIAGSISALENQLNQYFVKLVNDSSDAIHDGLTEGFNVNANGEMTDRATGTAINASWLYIDPSIGNDTNTDEISSGVGGWWYLVADDGADILSTGLGDNAVKTVVDTYNNHLTDSKPSSATGTASNTVTDGTAFKRKDVVATADGRLDAKLYEIIPNQDLGEQVGNNNGTAVKKVVSDAFPFVNGTFALPTDALTNVFANAKISFKIAFQALQAFFPYTETIDGIDYTSPLLGTAKALSIRNAIPIYNEAFDYEENSGAGASGL